MAQVEYHLSNKQFWILEYLHIHHEIILGMEPKSK
jgi:hypothetical protein